MKPEWIFEWMFEWLRREQDIYEEYWVRNIWGFGDKMRDYLLEGHRKMRMNW